MRLKVNDTEAFNLTLDLNVDYEGGCITVVVGFWSKKTHKREFWEYDGGEFDLALAKYRQFEESFFGS